MYLELANEAFFLTTFRGYENRLSLLRGQPIVVSLDFKLLAPII